MRYGRDYGMRYGRDGAMRYGAEYQRMRYGPRYDRGYQSRGPGRGMQHDMGYGTRYDRGYMGERQAHGNPRDQGWASAYPGPFSRGLPGGNPYERWGAAESHRRTVPWQTSVPGTGVGMSLGFGNGERGRFF